MTNQKLKCQNNETVEEAKTTNKNADKTQEQHPLDETQLDTVRGLI